MSSKSSFSNSTSQSYAQALYELAKENSELQKTEDGIDWRKCEKVESFESDPQQVFRINREQNNG